MSTSPSRTYPFREVQYMRQWWATMLIGGIAVLMWYAFVEQIVRGNTFGDNPAPDWMIVLFWAIFGIVFPVIWAFIRLIVELHTDHVHIAYIPFLWRTIPYAEIASATAITYQPLREFGGWGIRVWFGWRRIAYSVSGTRGVELILTNGRVIVLGSQRADALATAINAHLQ
ncbi:MAG: DUF6141 family protein [Anaerolineae bacterium]|nr:DUF6141 family protein [Anaerolineae bacterium]